MKTILLLFVFVLSSYVTFAQKSEVAARIGSGSLYQLLDVFVDVSVVIASANNVASDNYRGMSPISLTYTSNAHDFFSYSIEAQYVSIVRDYIDNTNSNVVGTLSSSYTSVMPRVDLNYLDGDVIGLSSSLGMGITFRNQEYVSVENQKNSTSRALLAAQIDLLKFRVGKKFNVFTDIGFGTRSLITFGVGYRF
jgi:hypothetical protein